MDKDFGSALGTAVDTLVQVSVSKRLGRMLNQMKFSAPLILVFVSIVSLSFAVARSQSQPEDQLISSKLTSLSASNGGEPIDCGSTTTNRPEGKVSVCAKAAFEGRKPFYVFYSDHDDGPSHIAYGLAGDAVGNVYEVRLRFERLA